MKRSLIFSMIFSILILTACLSPSGGVSAPTVTATQAAPTATKTATATETPSPESLLPQEVKEKFELAGIELANMENAEYDKDGLHITLESGEVIILTNTELQKGIYNGQDNVLQYRDEANQNVIYAFDKESGKWGVERPIKEFPWCKDFSKFAEYPVAFADLQEQARFVQSTLTADLFEPTKFSNVSIYEIVPGIIGTSLIPNHETAPNYVVKGSAPFLKDIMCGIATDNSGEQYMVAQVPYYVDGVPANKWPVMTGLFHVPSDRKGAWPLVASRFSTGMNIVPWRVDADSKDLATRFVNPKTGNNFTIAEVNTVIDEMKGGNFSNVDGLVLLFDIAKVTGGWYE